MDSALFTIVDKTISPSDGMFDGRVEHYFFCGQSALRVLHAAISLAAVEMPKRILDYGAGAGRVTRWMKAAFPESTIHACDLREGDMAFLRTAFGIEAWTVGTDASRLTLPFSYDLIWVGSVITHLSEADAVQLFEKLLSFCNPGGLLALSFHGQTAIDRQDKTDFRYIHDPGWHQIKAGYAGNGYGYADYHGQVAYGISVCTPSWMVRMIRATAVVRLVLLGERLWANHHDVVVVQKLT